MFYLEFPVPETRTEYHDLRMVRAIAGPNKCNCSPCVTIFGECSYMPAPLKSLDRVCIWSAWVGLGWDGRIVWHMQTFGGSTSFREVPRLRRLAGFFSPESFARAVGAAQMPPGYETRIKITYQNYRSLYRAPYLVMPAPGLYFHPPPAVRESLGRSQQQNP